MIVAKCTICRRSNDGFATTGLLNVNRPYSSNGLNQYTASGAINPTYDTRGNLTQAGTTTYTYNSENMLVSASGGTSASLAYDPLMRLSQLSAGVNTTRFAYDGLAMIAEYDGSNNLLRRHVFGPGMDEALVWYEGAGTTDRRWLHADERGSVIALSDGGGTVIATNSYDENGIPGSANVGRFQYTGQAWLPELGMQYSKARLYSPTLGRFLQTDPIGTDGGINIYAYVGNDPVNLVDPLGLQEQNGAIIVNGPGFCIRHGCLNALILQKSLGSNSGQRDAPGSTGTNSAKADNPHRFEINRDSKCSADTVFDKFKQPGVSAPGAPAAKEGFTPRVVLAGGNPISQSVNSSTHTIVNTTRPGHIFFPGTVSISVTSMNGGGSHINIVGTGTGDYAIFNDILGELIFSQAAAVAGDGCGSSSYTPVHGG